MCDKYDRLTFLEKEIESLTKILELKKMIKEYDNSRQIQYVPYPVYPSYPTYPITLPSRPYEVYYTTTGGACGTGS
jgi:hypothetical protein